MIANLDLVRDDWEAGHRRLELESRDERKAALLAVQVEIVSPPGIGRW